MGRRIQRVGGFLIYTVTALNAMADTGITTEENRPVPFHCNDGQTLQLTYHASVSMWCLTSQETRYFYCPSSDLEKAKEASCRYYQALFFNP